MVANVWNNQLGDLERMALGSYGNLQALFTAIPFDGKDSDMSVKLRGALVDNSGIFPQLNKKFASDLNNGLADPAIRDKIVKLNAEDPATLSTILDAAIKNPDGLVDRIKNTPVPSEAAVATSKFAAPAAATPAAADVKPAAKPDDPDKKDKPADAAPAKAEPKDAAKTDPKQTVSSDKPADKTADKDKKKSPGVAPATADDKPEMLSGKFSPGTMALIAGLLFIASKVFGFDAGGIASMFMKKDAPAQDAKNEAAADPKAEAKADAAAPAPAAAKPGEPAKRADASQPAEASKPAEPAKPAAPVAEAAAPAKPAAPRKLAAMAGP